MKVVWNSIDENYSKDIKQNFANGIATFTHPKAGIMNHIIYIPTGMKVVGEIKEGTMELWQAAIGTELKETK